MTCRLFVVVVVAVVVAVFGVVVFWESMLFAVAIASVPFLH